MALFFPDISCIINMMNLANTVPPPGGWRPQNPSFDAWKHCFAGCMMRKFCGPVSANAAAWGGEIYEAIRQKPWQQRDIDNTNTGIYCATTGCRWFEWNGAKGCTDCCLEQNQAGQTR